MASTGSMAALRGIECIGALTPSTWLSDALNHSSSRSSSGSYISTVTRSSWTRTTQRTGQRCTADSSSFSHPERETNGWPRSRDQRPFLLVASFTHPHDPFAVPQRYWDLYRDSDIETPAHTIALDAHSRRLRHVCAMDAEPVTEDEVRAARRAYYGAIAYIDDLLGRLMGALRSAALAEDTIVILTSDHGEMLGERGLWYKMSFFEGASRVPLIVASPSRFESRRVATNVSLVDLMPTLIELSGGNAQSLGIGVDGRSLAPHLRGAGGHDEAIGEYLAEGAIAPMVMIRRGPFKFIHSPADPDQLFDLSHDPGERDNLADNPASAALVADFRAEVGKRWDLAELDARVRESQRRRRLIDAALSKGKIHPWDFQPFRDAARQYIRNSMDLDDLERSARFPPVVRR